MRGPRALTSSTTTRAGSTRAAVAFLTTEAYWARWRSAGHQAPVRRGLARGGRLRPGRGHGRVRPHARGRRVRLPGRRVRATQHRGAGLGKAIVHMMIEDGAGAGWRWMLHTSDAHGLYRQFGFAAPAAVTWNVRSRMTRPPPSRPPSPGPADRPDGPAGAAGPPACARARRRDGPAARSCTAGRPCRRMKARSAGTLRRRSRPATTGTAAPFAVAQDQRTARSSGRRGSSTWSTGRGLGDGPGPARGGPALRDRLHLAQPEEAVRTGANTEMKRLMLTYAFETWQVALGLPCTPTRGTSRHGRPWNASAQRFEGILRAHRLGTDGKPRDSARLQRHRPRLAGRPPAPGGTGRPLRC